MKKIKKFLQIPCYQPWYNIVIKANGQIQPCCVTYESKTESIYDKNLEELWHGPYMRELRSQMLKRKLTKDCKDCNMISVEFNQQIRNKLKKGKLAVLMEIIKDYLKEFLTKSSLFKPLNTLYLKLNKQ